MPGWTPANNPIRRLQQAPEHQLADPGLAARLLGVEVKLAPAITDHDVRHLVRLREQLPGLDTNLAVVTTGAHAYRRPDGVCVVPLALLGP